MWSLLKVGVCQQKELLGTILQPGKGKAGPKSRQRQQEQRSWGDIPQVEFYNINRAASEGRRYCILYYKHLPEKMQTPMANPSCHSPSLTLCLVPGTGSNTTKLLD